MMADGKKNVLLAVSGSIAAYKACDIARAFVKEGVSVTVTLTPNGAKFVTPVTFETLTNSKCLIDTFDRNFKFEVEHIADWHEKHRLAKVNFGPDVLTRELICDTGAGYIKRPLTKNTSWEQARFEVCHHKWFDLSETDGGIAVINSGKYGVGLEVGEVSLSLLRATIRPDITSDMGRHDIRYLIVPHKGSAMEAQINHQAFAYNIPLMKASVTLPDAWRQALCESGLWLQSAKLSEDGTMLVLRLSEQDGARRLLRCPRKVKLLNMLEDVEGEADTLRVKPFEIITVGIPPQEE